MNNYFEIKLSPFLIIILLPFRKAYNESRKKSNTNRKYIIITICVLIFVFGSTIAINVYLLKGSKFRKHIAVLSFFSRFLRKDGPNSGRTFKNSNYECDICSPYAQYNPSVNPLYANATIQVIDGTTYIVSKNESKNGKDYIENLVIKIP
ncbi:hypothetical protein EDEG_05087 [Edhazardia aedis USNM 41457]|uniref:Uncharacterized protein n=1 Tax=Edhazardia aedis (strain USNM 41457) TaxID=1003232 RepID=A0A0L1P653_EDHAE|nr:hypothetical protein EDEG_05087 [Edhazardia aedis USNM 41457]|eukprot:KNH48530.1 hypothetical protein EDEG_05087 [Edhazardia aedis USNM 41457]